MDFPCTYTDSNGSEWHCETWADYIFCHSVDLLEQEPEFYEDEEYESPLARALREER